MGEQRISFFDSTFNLSLFQNKVTISSPYDIFHDREIFASTFKGYHLGALSKAFHRDVYHVYDFYYPYRTCDRIVLKAEPYKKNNSRDLSAMFTYPLYLLLNLDFVNLPFVISATRQMIHNIDIVYPAEEMARKQYYETISTLSSSVPVRNKYGVIL